MLVSKLKPGELIEQFQPKSEGLKSRKADGVSSSQKARRKETQEESMFPFEFKARKRPMCQLKLSGSRTSFLLSLFALDRPSMDWIRPPYQGEQSDLLSLPTQMLLLPRNTFTYSQNNDRPNVRGPCGLVWLTHKINHHLFFFNHYYIFKLF